MRSVPTVEGHALSAEDVASFEAGLGVAGLHFPGTEAEEYGFKTFSAQSDTTLQATYGFTGMQAMVSQQECRQFLEIQTPVTSFHTQQPTPTRSSAPTNGMLAVWKQWPSATIYGECLIFRVVRTPVQQQLWTSFAAHARAVTSLPHFAPPDAVAHRTPANSQDCVWGSNVCFFWSEFNGATYNCRPEHDLSNVLTPEKLLQIARDNKLRFPPPSPPPPLPVSSSAPTPPPLHQQCMNSELPRAEEAVEKLAGGCWRWYSDESNVVWPPIEAHRNMNVRDNSCPDEQKWTFAIKRDTFRMFNPSSPLRSSVERLAPSGNPYPDCDTAEDEECCIAPHQVHVPASANGNSDLDTKSGCKQRCNNERRIGFESACLPGVPMCLDAKNDPQTWKWWRLVTNKARDCTGASNPTFAECQTYAYIQGLDFVDTSENGATNLPEGCSVRYFPYFYSDIVYWHVVASGTPPDCSEDAKCVCKATEQPERETRFAETLCICGSRLSSEDAATGRRLDSTFVDPYRGGFVRANSTCRKHLYDFKRKWMCELTGISNPKTQLTI